MNPNINPEGLPNPFKHFCMSIGAIPTSYKNALDYYETLLWLIKYLENTVIPAVNNNAEALEELQGLIIVLKNYVEHYFDNLDVQNEINNKLDEMVEDGTLENLLNNYNIFYKNVSLLGKLYQKIIKKDSITINCQGDSLTYGQDNYSVDKRSPDSTPADDGAVHTNYRASITYPEELQTIFDTMFGSNVVTVNNLGYSGDTAKMSYSRWTVNRNADVVLLMLGTNDSKQSSWVPVDYRNNIDEYLDYMGLIIERYLSWNTAVILLTPPYSKTQNSDNINGNTTTNVYDDTLVKFANKYNCPIVQTEKYIKNNYNDDYYSDSIHLNGTGYKSFADKLFSIFCGTGIINSNFDITTEMFVNSSIVNPYTLGLASGLNNTSAANNQTANNKIMYIQQNGKMCYGCNIKYDNALIIPICTNGANFVVDFNSQQPLSTIKNSNSGVIYKNSITNFTIDTARTPAITRETIIKAIMSNNYLLIPSKGMHTIQVSNSNSSSVYFNGFIIMPLHEINKYVNDVVISLQNVELVDNTYSIPLNLINFLKWTNTTIEREQGKTTISPLIDLSISSGGGLECYKIPIPTNNRNIPISNASITTINELLENNIMKYYDKTYTFPDTGSHGSKSSLSNINIDDSGENLVLTFSTFNTGNSSIILK